jgi:hypothetical protein
MTIIEILKAEEAVLPETLRMLFPALSEEDLEKLQAINTLLHSSQPFENMYIFEKIVLALNGQKPVFSVMEGATPEQIFYAFYIIGNLDSNFYFDWEVKQWVKYTLEKEGVFFLPPELNYQDKTPIISYIQIKEKAKSGPFPLGDDTLVDIQASRWLSIQMYIDNQITKDVWNSTTNQEL